jgi:multicomponent Na+:H+ antiporter subunit B
MLRLHPVAIAGIGLLVSAVSGLVSVFYGAPYMTGLWFHVLGLDLATVMSFDIGVYLVVLGAFASILLALEEREGD